MPDLITYKFQEDVIKNGGVIMSTIFPALKGR